MGGYEEQLLTRAEMLEDTDELVQAITAILAGAQDAGVDPAAVTSLADAARVLDPGASTSYDAGAKEDRCRGGGYGSDAAMLEAVSEAEGRRPGAAAGSGATPRAGARGGGRRTGGARGGIRDAGEG
jgi:hypothetical protein